MVAREGFRYVALLQQRHTKYGRMRGMVVGEGGRSTGVLLYVIVVVVARSSSSKLPSGTFILIIFHYIDTRQVDSLKSC